MMLDVTLQRWWSKLAPHAPRAGSILLGALIAAELGRIAFVLPPFIGIALFEAKSLSAVGLRNQMRPGRVDAGRIMEAHLFGDATAKSLVEPASDADAPRTSANLVVSGTIAAADPKRGAVIVNDAGKSAVYLVGEDVGGASVYAVYVDRVILNRGGKLESLVMPRSNPLGIGSAQYADENSDVRKASVPVDAESRRGLAEVVRVGGAVGNETGQIRGFHIYPGKDRTLFADAGLHGGDLVVAVNGISVLEQSRKDGREAFNAIGSAERATVTIERFGKTTDVTIDAAQAGTNGGTAPANGVLDAVSAQ